MSIVREVILPCPDGTKIAAQVWTTAESDDEGPEQPVESISKPRRILCLHGWMDNCRSFHLLAPGLVESLPDDTECVALDLPGNGLSSHKSPDGPPDFAESAFYVAEAIRQLQWDKDIRNRPITLIGHSLGAGVACLYTAAFPEQVEKLVLIDGPGALERNPEETGNHVRNHILRRLSSVKRVSKERVYSSLEDAVAVRQEAVKAFPGEQWISDKAAHELVSRGTHKLKGGGVQFRHDKRWQMPSARYFSIEQVEAIYRMIDCPVAMILARDGWPFEGMDRRIKLLRPAVLETLPGSHHLHADPDTSGRVVDVVRGFMLHT